MSRDGSSSYMPMPNLVGDEEDTLAAASVSRNRPHLGGNGISNAAQEMSVITKTTSQTHYINWAIDSRSLRIARLAAKGEKRGVIEANVERNGHEFKLELCASGWRNSQDGYSAFYLTVKDKEPTFVARYRVQVGEITRLSSIRHDFHLGVGFPNFCEQTALEAILMNDNLNFLVTVEVFNCQSQVVESLHPDMANPERLQVLSRMLESIYKQRLHTDVTLVCGRRRIPAHKAILAAASPVFRAMFEHTFVERTSGEVCVSDFLPQTVEAMVRFLYTAFLETDPSAMKPMEDGGTGDLEDDLEDMNTSQAHPHEQLRSASPMLTSPSPSPEVMGSATAMLSIFQMEVDGKASEDNAVEPSQSPSPCFVMSDASCPKNSSSSSSGSSSSSSCCSAHTEANQTVFNLFRFAEMYKITSLVIACCQKMHAEIDVNNTCELLIKLDRYSHVLEIGKIQESIWEYVKNNYHDIKQTPGFQTLLSNHPDIVRQLMDKLL